MNDKQLEELLYEALETEKGGIQIYEKAISCARDSKLKEEWQKYHEQTQNHERILLRVFDAIGLDANRDVSGRKVVRHIGECLIKAMDMAKKDSAEAAELVATECVTLAETKDHQNWELLAEVAKNLKDDRGKAIKKAVGEVEDQEDEHLYHTRGWSRELWIKSLGMKSVIPPPEEEKDVKTAIAAARAKSSRERMG